MRRLVLVVFAFAIPAVAIAPALAQGSFGSSDYTYGTPAAPPAYGTSSAPSYGAAPSVGVGAGTGAATGGTAGYGAPPSTGTGTTTLPGYGGGAGSPSAAANRYGAPAPSDAAAGVVPPVSAFGAPSYNAPPSYGTVAPAGVAPNPTFSPGSSAAAQLNSANPGSSFYGQAPAPRNPNAQAADPFWQRNGPNSAVSPAPPTPRW
jgi:hypothetical protein